MTHTNHTVIGIDVGGTAKGYHAVALRDGLLAPKQFATALAAAAWCREKGAKAIAIDAPCAWAMVGCSRLAERSISIGDTIIQCFKTPTRSAADGRPFFGWVFNGEALYRELLGEYRLYDGTRRSGRMVLETFPHAVSCALAGRVISAKPKASTRRGLLRAEGYQDKLLANIDFVDAALCALTAERFLRGQTRQFGDRDEGFIVVPDWN